MRLPSRFRRKWSLALEATAAIVFFRILLWVASFDAVRRVADRVVAVVARSEGKYDATTIGRVVDRAARLVPRASCLVRALAARALLAANGHPSTIHIGVQGSGESFEAHAWVVCDGDIVVGGEEAGRYRTLLTLGTTGRA